MKDTENIFKSISRSDPCYNLNKTLLPNFYPHDCFYQMNENRKLIKYFNNYNLYKWELYVYNRLLQHGIVPIFINYGNSLTNMNSIAIDTSDIITFRKALCALKEVDQRILINELFSFINKLKDIGIFHNNLTIDSLYVNIDTFKFYIIEFTNMKIRKNQGEIDSKEENSNIDIYSLYSSIISDNNKNNNNDIINYIKTKCNLGNYDFIHQITDYYT
jgi:hypothetical protein